MREFPKETNIWIGGLSEVDFALSNVGDHHPIVEGLHRTKE
jgi:hypothetical protein